MPQYIHACDSRHVLSDVQRDDGSTAELDPGEEIELKIEPSRQHTCLVLAGSKEGRAAKAGTKNPTDEAPSEAQKTGEEG